MLSLYNIYILCSYRAICYVGAIVCQVFLSSLWSLEWDLDWISMGGVMGVMGLLNSRFHFMVCDFNKDIVLFRLFVCYSTFRTNESTVTLNHQDSGSSLALVRQNVVEALYIYAGWELWNGLWNSQAIRQPGLYCVAVNSSTHSHLCLVLACIQTASSKL